MANSDHVAWIQEGQQSWNDRRENSDFIPDLSGSNFKNFDFSGYNLNAAFMTDAFFIDCKFNFANLKSTIFGVQSQVPRIGVIFLCWDHYNVDDKFIKHVMPRLEFLSEKGFSFVSHALTEHHLSKYLEGSIKKINKVIEGQPHCVDSIINGDICFTSMLVRGNQSVSDSLSTLRASAHARVALTVSLDGFDQMVEKIEKTVAPDADIQAPFVNQGAILNGSEFLDTDFTGAILNGSHFHCANLSTSKGLKSENLNLAYGTLATKLPEDCQHPSHWYEVPGAKTFLASDESDARSEARTTSRELIAAVALVGIHIESEISERLKRIPNDQNGFDENKKIIGFLEEIKSKLDEIDPYDQDDGENYIQKLQSLGADFENWFSSNRQEVIDTTIRIPAMAGAIALLSAAGASMGPATIAAIALIGGPRIFKWMGKLKSGWKLYE